MCISPFFIRNHLGISVPAPCGKCPECLAKRKQDWYLRLKQESLDCNNPSWFVTLTYQEEFEPKDENGNQFVSKTDCQLFFKRLRYYLDMKDLKYYLGAEYGPETLRPHYHFVLFDIPPDKDIVGIVLKSWNKGFITCDKINDFRLRYVAKYINSKSVIPSEFVQPFSLMSKGLGKKYIDKFKSWHNNNPLERNFILDNGYKNALPRYYKDKIFSQWNKDRLFRHSEIERFSREEKKLNDYCKKHPADNTSVYFDLLQQEKLEKVRKFKKKLLQNGKI